MITPSQCARPAGLIECDTVLDIGPGIRPMGWYKPRRHLCVEPCPPYAERLRTAGYQTYEQPAHELLPLFTLEPDSAVYMLDVIEHMQYATGAVVLQAAQALRPKQVVVYTPNGFLPQHGDAWNLGGEHWQEHRSGWTPEDFPGWAIERQAVPRSSQHPAHEAFFAVWTRP